jgi:hypothetical protein
MHLRTLTSRASLVTTSTLRALLRPISSSVPAAVLCSLFLQSSLTVLPARAQMVRLPLLRPLAAVGPLRLPDAPPQKPIRQIIVRLKPGVSPQSLLNRLPVQLNGMKVNGVNVNGMKGQGIAAGDISYVRASLLKYLHILAVSTPAKLDAALAVLRANPDVVYAQPDHHLSLSFKRQGVPLAPPNDFYWGKEDLEHLIVVLAGLDTPDTARDDDSSYWTYTWSLETVNAYSAWQTYPGVYHNAALRKQLLATNPARLPRVAVIDTGVDMTHPDFSYTGNPSGGMIDTDVNQGGQLNISLARNLIEGNQNPDPTLAMDDIGHGTSVSGVIAAAPNNGAGIPGLGFPAQIVPIKVIDAAGNGNDSDLLDAITYATDNKCLLINTSLNLDTTDFPQALQDAADYAWNHGSLIIAAAGNDGDPAHPLFAQTRRYPASLVHVLAVAASAFGGDGTVSGEQLASYSNNGYSLGVTAPGGDITTFNNTSPNGADFGLDPIQEYVLIWTLAPTYMVTLSNPDPANPDGLYAQLGLYGLNYGDLPGTSLACPHVVGLAALYAASRGITTDTPKAPQLLVSAIERGAQQMNGRKDGGFDTTFGWGRIDAYNTLRGLNARNAKVGGLIGQVTVKGTPINNVQVTATLFGSIKPKRFFATTFPDGIYHMVNVPAGRYHLTVSALGFSQASNITITAGCDTMGINFPL